MGMPRYIRHFDLGRSAWPQGIQGIHKLVSHPPTPTLPFGTLTRPTHQNLRALYGSAFVAYIILIVSRSAALSYFAIYLAAG